MYFKNCWLYKRLKAFEIFHNMCKHMTKKASVLKPLDTFGGCVWAKLNPLAKERKQCGFVFSLVYPTREQRLHVYLKFNSLKVWSLRLQIPRINIALLKAGCRNTCSF